MLSSSVFAYFPGNYIKHIYNTYSEICIEKIPYVHWYDFLFGSKDKYICNLKEIRICNFEQPKKYDCQKDIERNCFRDCKNYSLEYNHIEFNLFNPTHCWCIDDIPKQIW